MWPKSLLLIPSFYGGVMWAITFTLYCLPILDLYWVGMDVLLLLITMLFMFVISACVFHPLYAQELARAAHRQAAMVDISVASMPLSERMALLTLFALGIMGAVMYINDLAAELGAGIVGTISFSLGGAEILRKTKITSTGTQLAYLGWLACGWAVYAMTRRRLSASWLILVLVILLSNLVYADRTKPVTILIGCGLMWLVANPLRSIKRSMSVALLLVLAVLALFAVVAFLTGKVGLHTGLGDGSFRSIVDNGYLYLTSSYPYLAEMIMEGERTGMGFENVLAPLFKLLAAGGWVAAPPEQFLDFRNVPYATNVGTFMTAFYMDGGVVFLVIGILIYSLGLDYLGLLFLRAGRPVALYAWATCIFVSIFAFFVPKLAATHVWLFLGLGLVSALRARLRLFPVGQPASGIAG